jgi:large subunit ribosomal protein L23
MSAVTKLSQERLINVLLAPHVTEKTALKVHSVNVINEPGKVRRFGKTPGRTQDWKKAYVRLAPGQTIDYEARKA